MKQTIKICGLSTPESVIAARDGGATHLGFIFYPKSPRNVSPQQAGDLVTNAADVPTVAVTVDADDRFLNEIVETMRPDVLQLHGRESLDRVEELKTRYKLPIIKAFAIRDADDVASAEKYDGVADILLLDAKPPKSATLPGGNGVTFDWLLIRDMQSHTPVLLSGGLNLHNVAEAMVHVRDGQNAITGLDISSGVESAPGVKDISKIEAFLAACR